jgi:GNAT superfamily N-acetyltransferase
MTDVDLPTMTIRAARPADVAAMAALVAELFVIEKDFKVDRAKQENGLRMIIERPSAGAWVVELGGRIVGMATAQAIVSTAEGGESAWVEDVIVTEKLRGRGIGRKLIEAVQAWCAARGATRMQLLADGENQRGVEFYEGRGWQRTRMVAMRKHVPES